MIKIIIIHIILALCMEREFADQINTTVNRVFKHCLALCALSSLQPWAPPTHHTRGHLGSDRDSHIPVPARPPRPPL